MILYKKNSIGNILEWEIWNEEDAVCTRHGVSGGQMQYSRYVAEAKNYGQSNFRDSIQQAITEIDSKIEHQLKYNGYFRTIEEAQEANNSRMPAGGFKPMKAFEFNKFKHKLGSEVYVQPKLDGMRCIAYKENDIVKLYSSSGREILYMDHVTEELNDILVNGEVLDGELYCHGMPLNQILSTVRREVNPKNKEERQKIAYHVFDCLYLGNITINDKFKDRYNALSKLFEGLMYRFIRLVQTYKAVIKLELNSSYFHHEYYYKKFIHYCYEGIMYRDPEATYQQKRSYGILKRKEFKELEFIITGVEDGKGKAACIAVNFIVNQSNSRFFSVVF
jgi:DNA ligase-1